MTDVYFPLACLAVYHHYQVGPRPPLSTLGLLVGTCDFFYVDRAISESDFLLLYIFIVTLAQISGLIY